MIVTRYPLLFLMLVSSCISIASAWKFGSKSARVPLMVFLGSYVVTTVIGATIIGVTGGDEIWSVLNPSLDASTIRQINTFKYWFLLYSPLIIPPLCIAVFGRRRRGWLLLQVFVQIAEIDIALVSYFIVLFSFTAYCVWSLSRAGFLSNLLLRSPGDYYSLISLRANMMRTMSGDFYGVLYETLPTLCSLALYQALTKKNLKWWLALISSVTCSAILVLATIQKSPVLILGIGLLLGLVLTHRYAIRWVFPVAAAAGILLLTFLETVFVATWTTTASILLVMFRMADSFPFYVRLFPHLIPYQQLNYGLGLLGFGTTQNDNLLVFDYMYPTIFWVQGAAAAPAHVRAFAQGGIAVAVYMLVIIAVIVFLVGRMIDEIRGPMLFSAVVQGFVMLYFLTQTSLRGALIESYGYRYVILGLASIWFVQKILGMAAASVRLEWGQGLLQSNLRTLRD